MPGSIKLARDFGEVVAIDLFSLADCYGEVQSFLNILDVASTFQLVTPVATKHPSVVWEALLRHWIMWAGPPQKLIADNGGEFKREVAAELESMSTEVQTTAALAPTQNAACERAGGAWKVAA